MALTIDEVENNPKHIHFTHEHPLEHSISCQSSNIMCSGCNMSIQTGKDHYTCKPCSYSLHRACYNMPSLYQHPADPGHDLNLLLVGSFECKACGLQGSGLCYSCGTCLANYHALCLRMPLTEFCTSHQHVLGLQFSSPYGRHEGFRCDVCGKSGSDHWLYRCSVCEFDVHINCVYAMPSS